VETETGKAALGPFGEWKIGRKAMPEPPIFFLKACFGHE